MPHPVAVDQPRAGGFGNADHPSVDMLGDARDQVPGRFAKTLRPVLAYQIVVAADAAGGDDHGLGAKRELADEVARRAFSPLDIRRFEDHPADAVHSAVGDGERIDPVTEAEAQIAVGLCLARAALERFDDAGAGAPGDVKPWHRIAVAHGVITAALGPADDRKDPMTHGAEPIALLAGCERDIGFRPALRPKVFRPVEAGRSHPVLEREIVTVLDAKPALLRAIDQEQAAERPKRLAAKALLALLIDHYDMP